MNENNKDNNTDFTDIGLVHEREIPHLHPEVMTVPPRPPSIRPGVGPNPLVMRQDPLQDPNHMLPMPRNPLTTDPNQLETQPIPKFVPPFEETIPKYSTSTRQTLCSVRWWRTCCKCCCHKPCVITVTGIAIFATVLSIVLAVLLSSTPSARGTQSSTGQ